MELLHRYGPSWYNHFFVFLYGVFWLHAYFDDDRFQFLLSALVISLYSLYSIYDSMPFRAVGFSTVTFAIAYSHDIIRERNRKRDIIIAHLQLVNEQRQRTDALIAEFGSEVKVIIKRLEEAIELCQRFDAKNAEHKIREALLQVVGFKALDEAIKRVKSKEFLSD
jgi:hypothetical protein